MRFGLLFIILFLIRALNAQVNLEGFVFETGNRGYLHKAKIIIQDKLTAQIYNEIESDQYGQFKCSFPPVTSVIVKVTKDTYKPFTKELTSNDLKTTETNYIKAEMERAPGYQFEITLADKKDSINHIVDAVIGAQIEVYNNTLEKEVLNIISNPTQEFNVNLEKGNHYTILVRKHGYLAKQMEVYVNIKGCILCFEGISNVRPGVTENLTAQNEYGVLLANVEMEKVFSGKSFEIKNIIYDLNSANLQSSSKKELDKVINLLKYNPNLSIELGSHTDSRGTESVNLTLSERRAKSAVDYIVSDPLISRSKIIAKGYGEKVIINKCREGVICSEADHAVNRRTEVKVTSLSEDWFFKPLINIKNEEKFQREFLKSSQLGGVEMVKPNAENSSREEEPTEVKERKKGENEIKENKSQTAPISKPNPSLFKKPSIDTFSKKSLPQKGPSTKPESTKSKSKG
jgi:outer membrane protein OmpA-like peptidoglycan-associated protein